MSSTVSEMQDKLASWHHRSKGYVIDVLKTHVKLTEEVGELAKAILKGDNENAKEELADCFIVLFHLARYFKVDVLEIMEAKYQILEKRLKEKKK